MKGDGANVAALAGQQHRDRHNLWAAQINEKHTTSFSGTQICNKIAYIGKIIRQGVAEVAKKRDLEKITGASTADMLMRFPELKDQHFGKQSWMIKYLELFKGDKSLDIEAPATFGLGRGGGPSDTGGGLGRRTPKPSQRSRDAQAAASAGGTAGGNCPETTGDAQPVGAPSIAVTGVAAGAAPGAVTGAALATVAEEEGIQEEQAPQRSRSRRTASNRIVEVVEEDDDIESPPSQRQRTVERVHRHGGTSGPVNSTLMTWLALFER